ncbi:transposase [Zavarzinella formosa]|uniref:transposase n=1 Tax=Zavarzinella formosa TaxID=360055 RepID=UPI0003182C9E
MIPKHQRRLEGFDEKILALYAKGLTTRDIQEVVKELYGVDVSLTLVSEITMDLDAEVTAWRTQRFDVFARRSSVSTASSCMFAGTTGGSHRTRCTWPWA